MKIYFGTFSLLLLTQLIFGCAFSRSDIYENKNSVTLQQNNFVIRKKVIAEASAIQIIGIPITRQDLANAVSNQMGEDGEIYGKSKVFINYTKDDQITAIPSLFFPIVVIRTLKVSADVAEFK